MPRISNEHYGRGLARGFGGAVIFAFPLLMTMEMWWLGFIMSNLRLLVFLVLNLVMLVGLSYFAGFEPTFRWRDDLMDALAACAVGYTTSAALLGLFGLLTWGMPWSEIVGKIAVQSVPASIGAMVARKQLGADEEEDRKDRTGYRGELFLMTAGALFLAFNVAPTQEMVVISYKLTPWHAFALVTVSILVLHAFVYTVGFAGEAEPPETATLWTVFSRYTLAGYGIALLISLYCLWTFGRIENADLTQIAMMTVVLGFPAALGAATARLVI